MLFRMLSINGSADVRIAPISIVITIAKGSPPIIFGIEKSLVKQEIKALFVKN
jgi:hypothetical protein